MAEQNGLIGALTAAMLERVLETLSNWDKSGLTLDVSVNFVAESLNRLELPDDLLAKVTSHSINPSQLIIEITESTAISELDRTLHVLTRLRMKGFHLSIDDFGTGFSVSVRSPRSAVVQ